MAAIELDTSPASTRSTPPATLQTSKAPSSAAICSSLSGRTSWSRRTATSASPSRRPDFGLIGRTCSGKSTILKMVAGIAKPSTGRISVQARFPP
jgi:ABC-type transport system involved in cytochrome bd biosynthesis fused ATPase/permease subunit